MVSASSSLSKRMIKVLRVFVFDIDIEKWRFIKQQQKREGNIKCVEWKVPGLSV